MLLRYLLPVLLLSSALLPARGQTSATPPGPDAPPTEALPPSVPPTPEPAAASLPATVTADAGGFTLQSADGAFALRLRGDVMTDGRFFVDDPDGLGAGTFYVRRIRPVLQGTLYGRFDFKLMPNFAQGRAELQDAYLDARLADAFAVRAGKFKVPVGLELLQSPTDLALVELAFPTALVPNRDVGVQLHGSLLDGAIDWALGLYNGVPNGQSGETDANDSKDYVGRVFAHPFRPLGVDALKDFGIGFAANFGDQAGPLPQYRTAGQNTFFQYASTASAAGERTILSPQAYYYVGPIGVLGEYVHVSERVTDGTQTETVRHQAFQVMGSVAIGGKPSFKSVSPDEPFDPEEGGFGALELAGRYTEIRFDSDTFESGLADSSSAARRASAWAIGANWYFAPKVRLQLNYERTTFRDGDAEGNRPAESLLVSRVQVAF